MLIHSVCVCVCVCNLCERVMCMYACVHGVFVCVCVCVREGWINYKKKVFIITKRWSCSLLISYNLILPPFSLSHTHTHTHIHTYTHTHSHTQLQAKLLMLFRACH